MAGTEIERKLLVAHVPDDLATWDAERIEQGYLAVSGGVEVRVRRKGAKTVLTVKSAPGLVRVEEELPLAEEAFANLWPLTQGRRIEKVRHTRGADPTLELDVYEGALAGLLTLEVEFPDAAAASAWDPPAWAGDDVTGDSRYANQSLALHGAP